MALQVRRLANEHILVEGAGVADHGDAAEVGSIAWADAELGGSDGVIELLPGTYDFDTSITIAATTELIVRRGVDIVDGAGNPNFTVNGTIRGGAFTMFTWTGAGTVTISGIVIAAPTNWIVDSVLLNDVTQADGKYIATDKVRARDGDGLLLENDGGDGIEVTDDGIIHMATQSGFSAYMSADQDIGTGAAELVEFDQEEDDIQNEMNLGTYTATIAADGAYQVSAIIKYKEEIANEKYMEIYIKKNDAHYTRLLSSIGNGAAGGASISLRIPLVATDTIQIWTIHNHGANRELDKTYCRFSIAKVA